MENIVSKEIILFIKLIGVLITLMSLGRKKALQSIMFIMVLCGMFWAYFFYLDDWMESLHPQPPEAIYVFSTGTYGFQVTGLFFLILIVTYFFGAYFTKIRSRIVEAGLVVMSIFIIYQVVVFSLSYGYIATEGIFYSSETTMFHKRFIAWNQIEKIKVSETTDILLQDGKEYPIISARVVVNGREESFRLVRDVHGIIQVADNKHSAEIILFEKDKNSIQGKNALDLFKDKKLHIEYLSDGKVERNINKFLLKPQS